VERDWNFLRTRSLESYLFLKHLGKYGYHSNLLAFTEWDAFSFRMKGYAKFNDEFIKQSFDLKTEHNGTNLAIII